MKNKVKQSHKMIHDDGKDLEQTSNYRIIKSMYKFSSSLTEPSTSQKHSETIGTGPASKENMKVKKTEGNVKEKKKSNHLSTTKLLGVDGMKTKKLKPNAKDEKRTQSLQKNKSLKVKKSGGENLIEQQSAKPHVEKDLSFEEIEKKIFDHLVTKPKMPTGKSKNPATIKKQKLNEKKKIPSGSNCIKSEGKTKTPKSDIKQKKKLAKSDKNKERKKRILVSENESNSEMSDWEPVDELSEILDSIKSSRSSSNEVQIELESKNLLWGIKNRKKRTQQEMIEDYFRKERNKSIKEVWENMHKTHLLCLLSHGMYINSILGSPNLSASALSTVPNTYFSPKRMDMNHLEKFLTWFCGHISVAATSTQSDCGDDKSIEKMLVKYFETKFASNNEELVYMFVTVTRAIGMLVRVIKCLTPMPWKPPIDSLIKPNKSKVEEARNELSNTSTTSNILPSNKIMPSKSSQKKIPIDLELEKKARVPKRKSIYSDDDFEQSLEFRNASKEESDKKRKQSVDSRLEKKKKHKRELLKAWAEVYVEEEEKWIAVDVTQNKIHCVPEIEARSPNAAYIVAFNPDQTIKDVTKRYVSSWLSCKDKIQCDGRWWVKTLSPYKPGANRRERQEDKQLETNLVTQPLPKTVNEYKKHPMYALQRHLLKFEAVFPPDARPVGFVKGEPVFRRACVRPLGGRESWIREAKTVRVGQEPYKVVKARPKWDKGTGQVLKDRPLELFGEWQVEDYEPPVAQNGKVPRNEYGNVELFKPCMVPRGCIHLPLSGLGRVARQLEVDCAPAVVGFEFHSGGSHPVLEGFVVCQEFKDILVDAWNQDQFEQAKKQEEKRTKRIYDNWKRLIKGLRLKARLREKYGVAGVSESAPPKEEKSKASRSTHLAVPHQDSSRLPHSLITHPVVNLKIDLSCPVAPKIRSGGATRGSMGGAPSALSSDTEEEDDDTKRNKIRSILQWHPQCKANVGHNLDQAHDLSDQTDDDAEEEHILSRPSLNNKNKLGIRLLETIQTELNHPKPAAKTKNQHGRKRIKTRIKPTPKGKMGELLRPATGASLPLASEGRASSGSEGGRRRTLRRPAKKTRPETKETKGEESEDGSPADVSVGESDASDETYHPFG